MASCAMPINAPNVCMYICSRMLHGRGGRGLERVGGVRVFHVGTSDHVGGKSRGGLVSHKTFDRDASSWDVFSQTDTSTLNTCL